MQHDFLPIAARELRSAARRKSTFRIRWGGASLAILASFIWIGSAPVAALPAKVISPLFTIQTACAFGFALLAGAFLTSDSLSEEKRDGTLALLFLTRLNAGDIVLGKFAATSLNAIYGLLALVPITAIPLLLGGVGFAEFARMALALINTLFFSLALGLCVSARVTDYSRGLVLTLGLLALFGAGLPGLAELAALGRIPSAWLGLSWLSPAHPFIYARETLYTLQPAKFWIPLLVSNSLGWISLALARAALPQFWREEQLGSARAALAQARRQNRRRARASDGPFDPVLRLVGDAPLLRWTAWATVAAWGALACAEWLRPRTGPPDLFGAVICAFILKVLIAFQVCRFFVETRRNGALELLLCTPLESADLIKAQWHALLRVFLWPVLVFLVLTWMMAALPLNSVPTGFAAPRPPGLLPGLDPGFIAVFFFTIGLGADVLATGWFGMWVALTVAKPGLAPALTILAVLILPAMLSHLDLVADMLFISWGTTRFQKEFRWMATPPRPLDA